EGLRVIRPQPQRLVVGLEGLWILALVAERVAEPVPGLGVARPHLDRPAERGARHAPFLGPGGRDAATILFLGGGRGRRLGAGGRPRHVRGGRRRGEEDDSQQDGTRSHRHVSMRRVTEQVAPKVGTNTECLPAPPATTIMMSDHWRAMGASVSGGRSLNAAGWITAKRWMFDGSNRDSGTCARSHSPRLKSSLLHPPPATVAACSGPTITSGRAPP